MTTEHTNGLSRRTLAKGAAWAVPVVAVAAAAPMVSASPVVVPPCVTFAFDAAACRRSNEGIYKFGFCINNTCLAGSGNLTMTITKIENGSNKALTGANYNFPQPAFTLAPGDQKCFPVQVWTAASQSSSVNIYGKLGSGPEIALFADVAAPQKTDACAAAAPAAATESAPAAKAPATTDAAPAAEAPAATEAAPAPDAPVG